MAAIDGISGRVVEILRSEKLLPEDVKAVYVAGSLARGWGNQTSDLDVYVIADTPWSGGTARHTVALDPPSMVVESRFLGRLRWEIQYWLDTQVDQMVAKVTGPEPGPIQRIDAVFLRRIGYGLTEVGAGWMRHRRAQIAGSRINKIMAGNALMSMDVFVEDATGQLDNGDIESAVLSAKLAFGWAVESVLASAGEFEESAKWRARRIRAAHSELLGFDAFWAIETMRDFDPADPAAWVSRVLGICQEVAMGVDLA